MRQFPCPAIRRSSLVCVLVLAGAGPAHAGNWPRWRGPDGTGVSQETGLPTAWSEADGLVWKCDLPEWGNSSPVVWGDAIFVTAQKDDELLLVKLSKKSKGIEWTRQAGSGKTKVANYGFKPPGERGSQAFHATQNLASPSAATDGDIVAAHFGNGDLAAYDFAGNRLWARNLQEDHGTYTIWWGHANSPVIHGDLVISVCMQDSMKDVWEKPAQSYVVAHEKRTGKEKWKTLRMTGATSEPCDAYTTPMFHSTPDGTEMIVVGGTWIDAYEPATGKQLWCLPGTGGNRTITGPALGNGMLYTTVGMRGPLLAVKLGGKGELPQESVAWRYSQSTPDSASPVVWGDLVFMVNDGGFATCLDAKTGERHWKEKLSGDHRASPVAAEGRVYFLNTAGLTTVVAASPRFEKVAENKIGDTTIASPAISDGCMYLRGKKALWCVGRKVDSQQSTVDSTEPGGGGG